jgi:hypothetical protein
MEAGKQNSIIKIMSLPLFPFVCTAKYGSLEDIHELGTVWVPQQTKLKSFDVLYACEVPGSLWIKITVGEKHPLDAADEHECLRRCAALNVTSTIAFCLPPDVFCEWYKNIGIQRFVTEDDATAANYQY